MGYSVMSSLVPLLSIYLVDSLHILTHFIYSELRMEYFGAYYKNNMYYMSTDQQADVVKHFVDKGKANKIVESSKIPNQHFSWTKKLQGH